jgi:hypothetical protein
MNEMAGAKSDGYQIERLPKFERTLKDLIKKHYRRNKSDLQKFEELIENCLENELKLDPCSDKASDSLPFPAGTAEQGFEFRKKRWRNLPGLKGAAKFGRLIFLVYHPLKIVYLIWIYTHEEFQEPNSQPPAKELKEQVKIAKSEIETIDLDSEPDITVESDPQEISYTEDSDTV